MKFHFDVDCTPEEARAFLGLPDLGPMQQRLLEQIEERLVEAIKESDATTLLESWMPIGLKTMEQWPALWAQMVAASTGMNRDSDGRKRDGG